MGHVKKEEISIYLESSPNPNSLKFVVNKWLIPDKISYDFSSPNDTKNSPLARELFSYPFVTRVFYASNFITVTKQGNASWIEVQNTIKTHIKNFLDTGNPLIEGKKNPAITENQNLENPAIVHKIKKILEEYVQPAVEQDGGAISFHSYVNGKVRVILQGACNGCPSSMVTLKAGIENLMKKMLPDYVREVEAV